MMCVRGLNIESIHITQNLLKEGKPPFNLSIVIYGALHHHLIFIVSNGFWSWWMNSVDLVEYT